MSRTNQMHVVFKLTLIFISFSDEDFTPIRVTYLIDANYTDYDLENTDSEDYSMLRDAVIEGVSVKSCSMQLKPFLTLISIAKYFVSKLPSTRLHFPA